MLKCFIENTSRGEKEQSVDGEKWQLLKQHFWMFNCSLPWISERSQFNKSSLLLLLSLVLHSPETTKDCNPRQAIQMHRSGREHITSRWINDATGSWAGCCEWAGTGTSNMSSSWASFPARNVNKEVSHRLRCLYFLTKSYEFIIYQNSTNIYIKCQQSDLSDSPTTHFKMLWFLDRIFIM